MSRFRIFLATLFSALTLVAPVGRTAVITVTGTGDTIAIDALTTLREAITSINNQADVNADVTVSRLGGYASLPGGTPDVINFNISGVGVRTISATSAEPTIVRVLTIDGYSQTGASANTLANADNAVILIQLDGTSAGASVDGLTLGAGSGGSTIKGLDITSFSGNGIVVQSNGNSILGNFVGVDPTGTTRRPNGTFPNSGDGIRILNASNNQIGSTNAADRNITSGNAVDGIHVVGTLVAPATGNIIQGNFVGVAADGKSSVGLRSEPAPAPGAAEGNNLFGIEISGGSLNTIGGTVAGARNVVGLNGSGIEVDNGGQQNIIQGNFSGVGADGVTPAKNLLHGIALRSSNGFGAPLGPAQANEPGVSLNIIGGTAAGAGNLVAFNGTSGIAVFGNPVSASGQANTGNAIEGNSVFQNGRSYLTASSAPTPLLGIDLTNAFFYPRDDGLTPNDSNGHGAPNDPNNFQNFPVLTSAASNGSQTIITGTLTQSVSPNTTFRVEFFANAPDPLNLPAEGQQFLGFVNITTGAGGTASFSPSFGFAVAPGQFVTATATDPTSNTSEFSAGVVVGIPPTVAKAFAPTTIPSSGTSVVTLTLSNSNATILTGGAFTDTLLNMSAVAGAVGGTCTGTTPSTLTAGQTALSFSGITIPASSSCTVTFSVTSSTVGGHPNSTSGVTTTQTPVGTASNTATLTVLALAPPTIAKAFAPTTIPSGGNSVVTLTLSNSNLTTLTGGAFTDTLASMSAVTGAVGGTCTGTTPSTLTAGQTALSFSGITIPASSSCTVTFSVTSSTVGGHPNSTSGMTTTQTPVGTASNTATLTVLALAPPTIAKAFAPTTIPSGGTSVVTLTLSNSNLTTLTGGAFTDTLANMSAVTGAVGGTCTGTTPSTLTAGQTALSFTGITIPASSSCTVTFSVTSSTLGGQSNTTSGVTTTQTPTAGTGSNTATLTVTLTPPVVATPTLNQWMLALLAGLLLIAGAMTARRQR